MSTVPVARGDALSAVEGARKLALVQMPVDPGMVAQCNPVLDATARAPLFTDSWSEMQGKLGRFMAAERLVGDQVLIIGDTALERDWGTAARAAGYLDADRYFPAA